VAVDRSQKLESLMELTYYQAEAELQGVLVVDPALLEVAMWL
jgi:hypothetical protein